ncbi:MAG: hypothetical protein IKD33_01170 [Bacteroidales bacterium]|nr:hypothetical protein [Bacteroidales bacterium]
MFLSAKAGIPFGESKYSFRRKGTINLTQGQGATLRLGKVQPNASATSIPTAGGCIYNVWALANICMGVGKLTLRQSFFRPNVLHCKNKYVALRVIY